MISSLYSLTPLDIAHLASLRHFPSLSDLTRSLSLFAFLVVCRCRSEILVDRTFNEHRAARGDILPETQALLKAFYAPFNTRLVELLKPGGARGLMLEEQAKEHGGKAEVESENEASGDEGAGRFTWEDVWLTHRSVLIGKKG